MIKLAEDQKVAYTREYLKSQAGEKLFETLERFKNDLVEEKNEQKEYMQYVDHFTQENIMRVHDLSTQIDIIEKLIAFLKIDDNIKE